MMISGFSALGSESHMGVGPGDDDWWTTYPAQNPESGSEVDHPAWILEALKDRPVLIYVHKGCSYCKPQTEAMAEIAEDYNGKIEYFDLAGDGADSKAGDSARYDPNGGANYVPLTVILTLAPGPDGNVQVVWHSSEDVTGKEWLKSYVEDAINYHEHNSASWKP